MAKRTLAKKEKSKKIESQKNRGFGKRKKEKKENGECSPAFPADPLG